MALHRCVTAFLSPVTGGISTFDLSRDQRYRGTVKAFRRFKDYRNGWFEQREYGTLNAYALRAALDAVTIDGERDARVRSHDTFMGSPYFVLNPDPENGNRVLMTMPCGETRSYRIAAVDRMLTAVGA